MRPAWRYKVTDYDFVKYEAQLAYEVLSQCLDTWAEGEGEPRNPDYAEYIKARFAHFCDAFRRTCGTVGIEL